MDFNTEQKYYYEEKGGHYFIEGLGFYIQIEREYIAKTFINYLREEFGDRELSWRERVVLKETVCGMDRNFGIDILKEEHGEVETIKILNELE